MNELELNTLFNIVTDPIKNVYQTSNNAKVEEIKRMVRVFNIVKSQRETCSTISARALVAFKMVLSNN